MLRLHHISRFCITYAQMSDHFLHELQLVILFVFDHTECIVKTIKKFSFISLTKLALTILVVVVAYLSLQYLKLKNEIYQLNLEKKNLTYKIAETVQNHGLLISSKEVSYSPKEFGFYIPILHDKKLTEKEFWYKNGKIIKREAIIDVDGEPVEISSWFYDSSNSENLVILSADKYAHDILDPWRIMEKNIPTYRAKNGSAMEFAKECGRLSFYHGVDSSVYDKKRYYLTFINDRNGICPDDSVGFSQSTNKLLPLIDTVFYP